ncbi:MAG: aminomethyl-transferring glycine dehydrogenase subunit GcvPA [Sulfolobales archaeon]|nr:aminomethyl-transferring glycine dehydrogenase subunit GcvPA [Sulfolobales archaeon]MCX8185545.1 aminomethyl-transferring glycine dehydrogenase subunit GcvPA [Sulfolobales archaeon]
MPHQWIPNSSPFIKKLLINAIGIKEVSDLFNDIPEDLIINRELNVGLGKPLSEFEVKRHFKQIISKNKVFSEPPPFTGGGICAHYVPSAVKSIISRGEFYSAYTPYQPEISQGILQALFEYQSLISELYGVDVVNASMYNGSTAAAEAIRMALRVNKRKRVLIPLNVNPEVYDVINTWSLGMEVSIERVGYDPQTGEVSITDLESKLKEGAVSSVYIESPNYFGCIEVRLREMIDLIHRYGALAIVNALPISLGVLESPGKLGADIVVGDAQSLGLGMNFGGPSAGILGVRDEKLVSQLPGRLIGATSDKNGKLGYAMILQTREQHIRRERATSNITTNSSLMAIASAVYLSLLGAEGIKKIGESILLRTYYAIKKLSVINDVKAPLFPEGKYFREVAIAVERGSYSDLHRKMLERGLLGGKYIGREFPELGEACIMCFTELHSKSDIDLLASHIATLLGGH